MHTLTTIIAQTLVATRCATRETGGVLGSNKLYFFCYCLTYRGKMWSPRAALVPLVPARGYDAAASIVFRYSRISISIAGSILGKYAFLCSPCTPSRLIVSVLGSRPVFECRPQFQSRWLTRFVDKRGSRETQAPCVPGGRSTRADPCLVCVGVEDALHCESSP